MGNETSCKGLLERLGVIETSRVVTKDLKWIFREQPIADVGIDGIIEQSKDGSPTGKFIAVQVKSGAGNFYVKEDSLTYSISDVHYHYWLQLDFPIILAAYIPNEDCIYWQLISRKNILRTRKKWKILIPKSQKLNSSSKKCIATFLSRGSLEEVVSRLYNNDVTIVSGDNYLNQSIISLQKIAPLLSEMTPSKKPNSLSSLVDFEVMLARQMTLTSKRLDNEISIFSKIFVEEIRELEKLVKINSQNENLIDKKNLNERLENSSELFSISIDKIYSMRKAYIEFSSSKSIVNKATSVVIDTLSILILELHDAKGFIDGFVKSIKKY